jgi:hypothetical protein
LVSLITGYCCLDRHLLRMGLTTSSVCASWQLEEQTAIHFVWCVCPTLATLRTHIFRKPIMNATEFTEVSASVIMRFAFQIGRLETNLWHNSFKYVRRLFIYDSCPFCPINVIFVFFFSVFLFFLFHLFPSYFSFYFSPRVAH